MQDGHHRPGQGVQIIYGIMPVGQGLLLGQKRIAANDLRANGVAQDFADGRQHVLLRAAPLFELAVTEVVSLFDRGGDAKGDGG